MTIQSQWVKDWRQKTKERIILSMGGACVCCGYNKSQWSLILHHINPTEKEFCLSDIRANCQSWDKIITELRKCVLVCSNCHVEIHEGITEIPGDHAKFNEKYANYKNLEKQERINDPSLFHKCPVCSAYTPNYKKHCSKICSSKSSLPVTKMAEIIGCSDVAIHKRLKVLETINNSIWVEAHESIQGRS